MRKGFTLLELIVVIIILGILATLGLTQYQRMIEKARGAEAKAILGDIRKFAAAYRLEYGDVTDDGANIGAADQNFPSACRASHYFKYSQVWADPLLTITASRCAVGTGKTPGFATYDITLASDLATGIDNWTYGY